MELDQIDIVAHREPEDFYNELRRLIASAQHRLVLSALYLGSGQKEQSLLQEVSSALENNPKLSVLFILDHSRARRGEKSSIDLLAPLVDKFYPRLQVCFYQMPQLKSAPYSWLPFWLQEVVAVYHCKFCVSDDTVLMTGANLSHDYFTDRQDRYWTIQSSLSVPLTADRPPLSPDVGAGPLAQYLGEFSQAVAKDSWLLSPGDRQLQPPNVTACALSAFLQQHPLHSPTVRHQQHSDSDKVVAFPLVQHAALGVEQEKDFFVHMLHQRQHGNSARHRRSDTAAATEALLPNMRLRQVQLCTPYTNFPKSLCNALRSVASGSSVTAEAPVHVQIIGPAPECHGFAGGKGFKEELPYLHEAALHADLFSPTKADPTTPVNIEWRQYLRPGWTLHRKGLWLGFSPEEDQATYDAAAPYQGDAKHYSWATYLGSSNFGERSWRRDLELGFFFLEAPGAAKRPSTNLVSVLQRVLRSESHDLVATSHVHLLPHHRQEETRKSAVDHGRRVSRPVDDERVPLMSTPTAAVTATPAQLAAKQGRAQRLHIRVLGWLLRSVL